MAVEIKDINSVEIEYISPRSLYPHPRNTKIYGDESVDALKDRILASKWIKPLVVTSNNTIISGHRRWRAATELGLISVPVEHRAFGNDIEELEALLLENESRDKTVIQRVREAEVWQEIEDERARLRQKAFLKQGMSAPVQENFPEREKGQARDKVASHVGFGSGRNLQKATKVVEKADRLVDEGNTAEASQLLETLQKSVDKAYRQVKQQEKQEEIVQLQQVDILPEPAFIEEIHVEAGQVWKLGTHLLFCGDSSSDRFIQLARQSSPAFAFADPPYNAGVAEWDDGFVWNHDYLIDLAPIVVVTPGISAIQDFMRTTAMPYKWSMSYWLDNGMTRGALGFGNWIYAAIFSNGSIYRNRQDFERVSISSNDRDELEHKGRKPLAMMLHQVKTFTEPGDVVVDPFLGTGSTLIVCEQTERRCIGAEVNPAYCESIIKRWEKASGEKAEVMEWQ